MLPLNVSDVRIVTTTSGMPPPCSREGCMHPRSRFATLARQMHVVRLIQGCHIGVSQRQQCSSAAVLAHPHASARRAAGSDARDAHPHMLALRTMPPPLICPGLAPGSLNRPGGGALLVQTQAPPPALAAAGMAGSALAPARSVPAALAVRLERLAALARAPTNVQAVATSALVALRQPVTALCRQALAASLVPLAGRTAAPLAPRIPLRHGPLVARAVAAAPDQVLSRGNGTWPAGGAGSAGAAGGSSSSSASGRTSRGGAGFGAVPRPAPGRATLLAGCAAVGLLLMGTVATTLQWAAPGGAAAPASAGAAVGPEALAASPGSAPTPGSAGAEPEEAPTYDQFMIRRLSATIDAVSAC